MTVHDYSAPLPVFHKPVVTIGTFDGIHKGHKQVLQSLKEEAGLIGGETVVITFHPHPRKIVSNQPLQLINTLPEKIRLLQQSNIDHLVVVPFTEAFANQPAERYVEDFLINGFHPHTVIIGHDHHFGKNRQGNFQLLEQYAQRNAFNLVEIPPRVAHEITISSTRVREALLTGNLDKANDYLGYTYFFEGTVVHGNKLGEAMGYPTANLRVEDYDKLIPGNGVYAVNVEIGIAPATEGDMSPDYRAGNDEGSQVKKGMMNIGYRPTVDGSTRMIEVNIFDFNRNIYGETLRVHLKKYLREERKFNGLEALKEQLGKDKLAALEVN